MLALPCEYRASAAKFRITRLHHQSAVGTDTPVISKTSPYVALLRQD